jgi:phosphotriesterase-related protein
MAKVETLTGTIDTAELGFTLMHEHVFIHSEGLVGNFPSLWDKKAEIDNARTQLQELYNLGVNTILDATIFGLGRDIPLMLEVASDLPINLIVTTGIYHWCDCEANSLVQALEIDDIADLFIRDIEIGVQGTNVKAGVVKAASDVRGITPVVEKFMRAAARTHRQTGVPLITHSSSPLKQGLQQQDIFEDEGVDLSRVIIGHAGDSEDIKYLKELMHRGSFIGMDRFGLEPFLSDDKRIAVVTDLCGMGYEGKMVLGDDYTTFHTLLPWKQALENFPKAGLSHVVKDILPALRTAGVTEVQIRRMTVENPRRIFETSESY